ncbi:MAG: hypothetical protein F6K47_11715 [Symploca sp. SIO2E6]|nr:hypothetical protein [Symploca sp. SIO2E6]
MSKDEQEQIKKLEKIKDNWQKKRLFYKNELVKFDDTGKRFELQQEIDSYEEKIEEITQEIESLRQKKLQKNKYIWQRISQEMENIPIQDKPIEEVFVTNKKTEPVVTSQWHDSVILWLSKLTQEGGQQEDWEIVTADNAIDRFSRRDISPKEARALAVFFLQYLAEEPSLKDETVDLVLKTAIKNLNEYDGRTSKPNTQMDKAFHKVMQSCFAKQCHHQLLQGYIQTTGEIRRTIGSIFLYTIATNSEVLNTENANRKLNPLLEQLTTADLVEERVEAGLRLVEEFFRPHIYNTHVRIDFLSNELLHRVINTLLAVAKANTGENNAIASTAIWALGWLTNSRFCDNYTAYTFTEAELDFLRQFATNKEQDVFGRSWSVSLLSVCTSEKPVFAQAEWIHEWAIIADGGKPQKQLPDPKPLDRPEDKVVLEYLISSDLPKEAKRRVAIALGRIGYFINKMVEPLLQIFQDNTFVSDKRDEALVYLVFTGGSQVISALINGINSPKDHSDQYGLPERCFLALIGMGDVDALRQQLERGKENQIDINGLAYALAGVVNPKGRRVLEFIKHNHRQKEIRDAAANALSRSAQWNYNNAKQVSPNYSSNNEDRFLAQQGHNIHKLKAKDSTGRWAYYFVYVEPRKEQAFLNVLESDQGVNLEDYGKVVGSCYGEQPDDQLLAFLKEKYGFSV